MRLGSFFNPISTSQPKDELEEELRRLQQENQLLKNENNMLKRRIPVRSQDGKFRARPSHMMNSEDFSFTF